MHKVINMMKRTERQAGGGRGIFTSSVEGESTLDHAVYETTHGVELFVRLEKQEGVEISCRHLSAL